MSIKPYFRPKDTYDVKLDELEVTAKLDKLEATTKLNELEALLPTLEVLWKPTKPTIPTIKRG